MAPDFLFAKRIMVRYHENIPFKKLVTHRFALDDADKASKTM